MKKVIISENQLKVLIREHRMDQKLPFDDIHGKKANYEHFIDWLEHIGKYGQISGSGDAEKLYEIGLKKGFERLMNNHQMFETDMDYFIDNYSPENYPEYYIEGENANMLNTELTEDGEQAFNDFMWNLYQDRVDIRYQLNDRNLIYIFRAISIPDLTSVDWKKKNDGVEEDYYQRLNYNYNGIGECWSYEESGAIPYGGGRGTTIIVYGLISPDDIDWVETCALNGTGMNEREIRIKPNVYIEIYQIKVDERGGKKLPL